MEKKFSKILNYLNLLITIFFGLAILYLIYRSEFHNNGEKIYYYLKYYLILIPLFFFSISLFFISQNKREKILFITCSAIFSFYLFEFFLIINSGYLKKHFFFDDRTRYEIYIDEKKINQDTIVSTNPIFFKFDYNINYYPLSGISKFNTINCNENGYYAKYMSDRYGYNNKDKLWDLDEYSFVLTGDSYAHGACVNYPNALSDVISSLSKKNIINLGLSGNGPLLQYAVLKEFFNYKKAKNIIFLYYEDNDLSELQEEIKHPILKKYFDDENFFQNIFKNQHKTNTIIKVKFNDTLNVLKKNKEDGFMIPSFFKLQNTRKFLLKISGDKENFESIVYDKETLSIFNENIEKVLLLTQKNNSNLYFVYIPGFNRFAKKSLLDDFDHLNYKEIINIIENNNIELIDFYAKMKGLEDPLSFYPFRGFGHFNEKGYKLLAEYILNKISENN